jgi:hypothetical protein
VHLDVLLVLISIDFLKKISVFLLHSEVCEPSLHASLLLVERDETVHKGRNSVVVTDLLLKSLTKWGLVDWRLHIFNVVHHEVFFIGGFVVVTAICASEAFVNRAVKPQDSVKATGNELLFALFCCGGLDEQVGVGKLKISLDWVLLDFGLIATQSLFKQLGLGVGAGEIAENPPVASLIL